MPFESPECQQLMHAMQDLNRTVSALNIQLNKGRIPGSANEERTGNQQDNVLSKLIKKDFKDSIQNGFREVFKGDKSFDDVFKILRERLEEQLLTLTVLNPLQNVLFNSGAETLFGSSKLSVGKDGVLGDLITSFTKFLGFGARATGGPVGAGIPYLVGERGPELFVPHSSGSIMPGGALAGGAVTVHMNIQTPDVAGFRASQTQIAAQMYDAVRRGQRLR